MKIIAELYSTGLKEVKGFHQSFNLPFSISMEDHKDIGILIKNRMEYAEKEELFDFDSEWLAIKPIVKNNFITWRLNTFNIYYLIFLIASLSLLLYYIFLSPKQELVKNAKVSGVLETITVKRTIIQTSLSVMIKTYH